jgi:hypothetical protein
MQRTMKFPHRESGLALRSAKGVNRDNLTVFSTSV